MPESAESKTIFKFFLAHHSREDCNHKCYTLPFGKNRYYICSRCLGLYPVLLVMLAVDLGFGFEVSTSMRALVFWIFILYPWSHWAREHYFQSSPGGKFLRSFTGMIAGVGIGVLLAGHFRQPWNQSFTFSIILLSVISFVVIFLKNFLD
jgi:uncharacterized membrane protein